MKRRLQFSAAELCETADELRNPFRGWYQIYTFRAEDVPDLQELFWCLKKEETCALVLIDISAYRDRDLDSAALSNIQKIFGFFDEQRRDIILRVVYDREGKCAEHEPSLFSQIITHISQLKPVIQKYRDRIVFFEGMLVGNWGEMHGSRFLTENYMQLLNSALEDAAAGIIRAVRRPVQWRMLSSEPPAEGTMLALYNDAIFGSDTDLGTFASSDADSGEWEQPWLRERELEFEEQLGEFVPQCGEAVCGEEYSVLTLEAAAMRLRRMHLTCLNGVYDDRILNLWKEWTWTAPDVWQGMNGYDYIGRHLGYRFLVRSAEAHIGIRECELTLTAENVGFSGFYQEAEARLILTGESETTEYLTDWDIRKWKSGQKQTLTWRIPRCEGEIYLSVKRKWDGETVRFANPSTDRGWIPLGALRY